MTPLIYSSSASNIFGIYVSRLKVTYGPEFPRLLTTARYFGSHPFLEHGEGAERDKDSPLLALIFLITGTLQSYPASPLSSIIMTALCETRET